MPDPMTAAPSGWLTEEELDVVDNLIKRGSEDVLSFISALATMARWSLSHQAALETVIELLVDVDTAYQAAGPGADTAMHEAILAIDSYLESLKGNAECPECQGKGFGHTSPDENLNLRETCERCAGTGKVTR